MSKEKLFLEEKEKANILSRRNLVGQLDYELKLVQSDLEHYVVGNIYPRLGIKQGSKSQIADDLSYIEVEENESSK